MKIIEQPSAVQRASMSWRCEGETIGFVPTMGALHEGHRALLREARAQCSKVIASVFVNPLQFGANEDYGLYPRPIEKDCQVLEEAGCDLLLLPGTADMYGEAPQDKPARPRVLTTVDVLPLGDIWEGVVRPGHLRGVATVVAKLFNITLPHRAYFGEKDYQQLRVVAKMVADLNFAVEVVPVATVREADGLAVSSRNVYLSPDERRAAPTLFRALQEGRRRAEEGETDVVALGAAMQQICEQEPLIEVQYIAVVDETALTLLAQLEGAPARALIAARVGPVRLIDNLAIPSATRPQPRTGPAFALCREPSNG